MSTPDNEPYRWLGRLLQMVPGKSSAMAWGGRYLYRILVRERGMDPRRIIVTDLDADYRVHTQYFAWPMQRIASSAQWLGLPFVGIIFSNPPALDAQTRLLTGRYLEYRVTEKA